MEGGPYRPPQFVTGLERGSLPLRLAGTLQLGHLLLVSSDCIMQNLGSAGATGCIVSSEGSAWVTQRQMIIHANYHSQQIGVSRLHAHALVAVGYASAHRCLEGGFGGL